MKGGISQPSASSFPPELCSPLQLQHSANSVLYSKPPIPSYFSLLWTILEEITWTSLQWEQNKEMNSWFQWYPWHRYWVAPLNILQPRVSLLNPLQWAQSHFPSHNTNTQVRIQESVLYLNLLSSQWDPGRHKSRLHNPSPPLSLQSHYLAVPLLDKLIFTDSA